MNNIVSKVKEKNSYAKVLLRDCLNSLLRKNMITEEFQSRLLNDYTDIIDNYEGKIREISELLENKDDRDRKNKYLKDRSNLLYAPMMYKNLYVNEIMDKLNQFSIDLENGKYNEQLQKGGNIRSQNDERYSKIFQLIRYNELEKFV